MIRSSNLVTIDFTTQTQLNLDDQVSLRDMHKKLIERNGLKPTSNFRDWVKKKLEHYNEYIDFIKAEEKNSASITGQFTTEYYTTVQIAMEILANGHGKAGHEMRKFMSGCVRCVAEDIVDRHPKLPFDISDPDSVLTYAREVYVKEHTLRLVAEDQADKEKAAREEAERLRTKIHKSRESTSTAKLGGLTASHNRLKEKIKLLEDRAPVEEEIWKTAAGWKKVTPQLKRTSESELGRTLAKFFRTNSLEIRSIPDVKFGKLNIYSEDGVSKFVKTLET